MRTHQLLKQMIVSGGITPKRIVNLIRNYSGFVVKNLHVSGFPSLVMIEPTNLCNLHFLDGAWVLDELIPEPLYDGWPSQFGCYIGCYVRATRFVIIQQHRSSITMCFLFIQSYDILGVYLCLFHAGSPWILVSLASIEGLEFIYKCSDGVVTV